MIQTHKKMSSPPPSSAAEVSKPSSNTSLFRKIQHWSGVAFSVFASLHVATTLSASVSPAAYDATLEKTRSLYRPSMAVEGLVVFAPLVLHMIANSVLFMTDKTPKNPNGSIWHKLHKYTGYALGGLVPLHVLGTRTKGFNLDFARINYTLEKEAGAPALGYFIVLLTAGVYHSIYGLNIALGYKAKKPLVLASILGVLAASYFAVLGFAGYLYPAEMVAVRARYGEFAH